MKMSGGKKKQSTKQTKIKKYSRIIFRKLMATPRKISFSNCINENGKLLPFNFSSVFSESRANTGDMSMSIMYFTKVPLIIQNKTLSTQPTIKPILLTRKGRAQESQWPSMGMDSALMYDCSHSEIWPARRNKP